MPDIKDYRTRARQLVIDKGRMTPTEIYNEIGKPPEGYRLKADGKGNVTSEQVSNRRARRGRATARRERNIKVSRPNLTPEEQKEKRRLEQERTKRRAQGEDIEILHKQRPSLTGPQLERLSGRARAKARKRLEKTYGRLGDSPENIELGSGEENRQEEVDWQKVQKRLGELEEKNPSRDNQPDMFKPEIPLEMAAKTYLAGINLSLKLAQTVGGVGLSLVSNLVKNEGI